MSTEQRTPDSQAYHDAEWGLVGACLNGGNGDAFERMRRVVAHQWFATPELREVWAAAHDVADTGARPDVMSVRSELRRRANGASTGLPVAALMAVEILAEDPGIDASAEYYGQRVRDAYRRRELVALAEDLRRRGIDPTQTLTLDGLEPVVRRIAEIATDEMGDSSSAGRFRLYDADELAALPAPPWLVRDVLPSNALALLVGEREGLKSFTALDVACHVDCGLAWHGRAVATGAVVYVYAEGRMGIGPRVEAWRQFHDRASPRVLFLPSALRVSDPGDVAALCAAIEQRLDGRSLALVVVDTLNRTMTGNENSAEDMSAYIRGCDTIRESTGAAVLVIHHKGHGDSDRARGSSVLEAAADTVIFSSRDAERLTLECTKQKDAAHFEPIVLEAVPVGPSLALRAGGPTAGPLAGNRLKILRVLHDESTGTAGLSFTAWHAASGLARSSFSKALDWLRTNAYVANDAGKWHMTDGGRMSLRAVQSTRSTGSPPNESGPDSRLVHHGGGLYKPPGVDHGGVDQRNGASFDPGDGWAPDESQLAAMEHES